VGRGGWANSGREGGREGGGSEGGSEGGKVKEGRSVNAGP